MRQIFRILIAIAIIPGVQLRITAEEKETTRQLWDTQFVETAPAEPATPKKPSKRRYKVATPKAAPMEVAPDTVVGISVWRLRQSSSTDQGARLLVQEKDETVEWTPQRVEADTVFSQGDRVRLSIEAAREGHLYVIDREQYADGTLGEPYLIFPTTRTAGGNNRIKMGRPVEIPSQVDKPPYFTVKPSRPDQKGEVLSILITPEPIEGMQTGSEPILLSKDQVAEWEKMYGKEGGHLELEGGEGQAWTKVEKDAAAGTIQLEGVDPRPQSLFYINNTKSGDTVLINVELKYKGN